MEVRSDVPHLGTPPGELQGTEVTLVWPPLSSGPQATEARTALKATDQWSRLPGEEYERLGRV